MSAPEIAAHARFRDGCMVLFYFAVLEGHVCLIVNVSGRKCITPFGGDEFEAEGQRRRFLVDSLDACADLGADTRLIL